MMYKSALLSLLTLAGRASFARAGSVEDEGLVKIETTFAPENCTTRTAPGDSLDVLYRGNVKGDEAEFDSNQDDKAPFRFTLGLGMVIKGWDEGLKGMCVEEKRTLEIPPHLGYGANGVKGKIPPNSTLVFQVRLLSVTPGQTKTETETETKPTPVPEGAKEQPTPEKAPPGAEMVVQETECKLLGKHSLIFQATLGLVSALVLVWKRMNEHPQRSRTVWFFDVSKQLVGSSMMHFANLALSLLSSGQLVGSQPTPRADHFVQYGQAKIPNPCALYVLNLGIDATVGVWILLFWLNLFTKIALKTPLAIPEGSLKSGRYDVGKGNRNPHVSWWLKQCLLYFMGLWMMKVTVYLMIEFVPFILAFGEWCLSVFEGHEVLQILVVMLIFPPVMNGIQMWLIDSFIKDQPEEEEEEDEVNLLSSSNPNVREILSEGTESSRPTDPSAQT